MCETCKKPPKDMSMAALKAMRLVHGVNPEHQHYWQESARERILLIPGLPCCGLRPTKIRARSDTATCVTCGKYRSDFWEGWAGKEICTRCGGAADIRALWCSLVVLTLFSGLIGWVVSLLMLLS